MSQTSIRLTTASAANKAAVLARLARDASKPEAATAAMQSLLDRDTLTIEDFLIAHREGDPQTVYGGMMTQSLGGAQTSVWIPVADSEALADALAAFAVAYFPALGQRVLQALTRVPPPAGVSSLRNAGFAYTSDLVMACREVTAADIIAPSERFTLEPAALDDVRFGELIEQTYIDSKDMPELNDTLSAAEILAGCRQFAKLEVPCWFRAMIGSEAAGVLQFAPAEHGEWELIYMGLVPSARGRKMGLELAKQALSVIAERGGTMLHLSYDRRNVSAERIYSQLGFVERMRRAVWLKIFRDSDRISQGLGNSLRDGS